MNFSLLWMLAWRYVTSTHNSTIRTMIGVCCTAIFVGTCALALVASIMRGFEYETQAKLQSIYPSLVVSAPEGGLLDTEALTTHIATNLGTTIAQASPYVLKEALLQPATTETPTCIVLLKGVDPRYENNVTHCEPLITPTNALKTLHNQELIVGKTIAEKLNVTVGETVTLVCNKEESGSFKEASLCSIPATVVGIITTGIGEYDDSLVLAPLSLCKKIWGNECITHCGIGIIHQKDEQKVYDFFKKLPDLIVTSWKERNPGIVSALKLEQYVMFLILFLISAVASMNIISLLFMYVTYKQTDIALLRMIGMSPFQVALIFLGVSLTITVAAAGLGLLVAYGIGTLLQKYPCIALPDAYYLTTLPVKLEWHLFASIMLATVLLTLAASLLPLYSLRNRSITMLLRSEQ